MNRGEHSGDMPYKEKRFSELLVSDVAAKLVQSASQVRAKAPIGDVIDSMLANPLSRKVYVVDEQGRYIGTVRPFSASSDIASVSGRTAAYRSCAS